jgi:transcription antitermination factor NusG
MVIGDDLPCRYPIDKSFSDFLDSWWVMHVKPNCEIQIVSFLFSKNIPYFSPHYTKNVKYGNLGRIRAKTIPLFPGYVCFVLDRDEHRMLYDTKKLVRILHVRNQSQFVDELTSIDRALASGLELDVKSGLAIGSKVIIESGPLQGMLGIVVRSKDEKRLALNVTMFNQNVIMTLGPDTIIKVI